MKISRAVFSIILLNIALSCFAADNAKHFPAIFLGYTQFDDETEFTYGIEYEYKFTSQWGVGALYERIDDAHHGDGVSIKLGSLFYHPVNDVRLGLGFGREKVGGDHPHSENLIRISAAYDFHFNGFGIAPEIAVDFVDSDEAYVFGFSFIKAF